MIEDVLTSVVLAIKTVTRRQVRVQYERRLAAFLKCAQIIEDFRIDLDKIFRILSFNVEVLAVADPDTAIGKINRVSLQEISLRPAKARKQSE